MDGYSLNHLPLLHLMDYPLRTNSVAAVHLPMLGLAYLR